VQRKPAREQGRFNCEMRIADLLKNKKGKATIALPFLFFNN
jgi:hypothetical protein